MIGLKYFFVYDKLYQSVLSASFDDEDCASLGDDPTGVVPYFHPTYAPTETKVFLTGQLAGILQVAETISGRRVTRLSLANDEVLVWQLPRCLLVMSYAGPLSVEHLETHFCPLVEQAAYFFLGHVVNNPPTISSRPVSESDLGYYDLPPSHDELGPDNAQPNVANTSHILIPEIYPAVESDLSERGASREGAEVFECVESMKLSDAEKAALDGFVFTIANLLHNLNASLRPEMTLLNLSKSGNVVFVESLELLTHVRKEFGATGGAIFFQKRLVTSTLGVDVTKIVSLVDLNAQVPAEVIVRPEESSGSRLGVYRVWVRSESSCPALGCGATEKESLTTSELDPLGSEASPEKISSATLRSMSKPSPGGSSANYWRMLRRAGKRRLRKVSEVSPHAQRKLDFDESFAVISLSDVADTGSFEDIPLSAAFSDFDPLEEEVDEVEVDDVDGREDHSDSESDGEDIFPDVIYAPAFLITFRLDDMEAFLLSDSVPENLNKLAEVLHRSLGRLEGSIWCRVKMTVAGNGTKPSRFGWFQWDHQWGSAIQEGKMAAAHREPLQLLHHQISSRKYFIGEGACEAKTGYDESDDDDVLEMVCRSGQDMFYGRASSTRDLFYWSECPLLRPGIPAGTITLAEFPEKARKHLKRLIM